MIKAGATWQGDHFLNWCIVVPWNDVGILQAIPSRFKARRGMPSSISDKLVLPFSE